MSEVWIPIADYSIKHKLSISTLRRRIKTNDINYRFEDGKYLILDAPADTMVKTHRPSLLSDKQMTKGFSAPLPSLADFDFSDRVSREETNESEFSNMIPSSFGNEQESSYEEPLTTSAPSLRHHLPFLHAEQIRMQNAAQQNTEMVNSLLAEIKKAYALILAEKEEQILQLKEEVSDLKTLTRILESELHRVRG